MKANQFIIDIPKKDLNDGNFPLISIPIDNSIPLDKAHIYLIESDQSIPVRLIYAQTYWVINEGHDFRLDRTKRLFQTRSRIFENGRKLLFTWGEDLSCELNHKIEDFMNFCPECGQPLDFKQIFIKNQKHQ